MGASIVRPFGPSRQGRTGSLQFRSAVEALHNAIGAAFLPAEHLLAGNEEHVPPKPSPPRTSQRSRGRTAMMEEPLSPAHERAPIMRAVDRPTISCDESGVE